MLAVRFSAARTITELFRYNYGERESESTCSKHTQRQAAFCFVDVIRTRARHAADFICARVTMGFLPTPLRENWALLRRREWDVKQTRAAGRAAECMRWIPERRLMSETLGCVGEEVFGLLSAPQPKSERCSIVVLEAENNLLWVGRHELKVN